MMWEDMVWWGCGRSNTGIGGGFSGGGEGGFDRLGDLAQGGDDAEPGGGGAAGGVGGELPGAAAAGDGARSKIARRFFAAKRRRRRKKNKNPVGNPRYRGMEPSTGRVAELQGIYGAFGFPEKLL